MTAAIVTDLRRAIELLTEIDEPAATRAAEALSWWLAGEDFDHAEEVRRRVRTTTLFLTRKPICLGHGGQSYESMSTRKISAQCASSQVPPKRFYDR
jgi:hypothetical protein